MSIETDILKAMQTAVGEAVTASVLPSLPIKYLMRTFAIPDDQKWLELVHLPNNVLGEFWGNEKTHRGTLRLLLHWQNDDAGIYSPLALVAQIGSYFVKDKSMAFGQSVVKIYENADYFGVVEAGTDTIFVLSIRYQCFAAE